jgi:hypothetical protein
MPLPLSTRLERMTSVLLVSVSLLVGCKARPCAEWRDVELPKLKKVDTCYSSSIAGTTAATEGELVGAFEKAGFVRGHNGDGVMTRKDPWIVLAKKDAPESFKMSLNGSGEFVIDRQIARTDFIPESEWKRLWSVPADAVAQASRLEAAGLPALFEAKDKAPVTCASADLLSREPKIGERRQRYLVNADALGTKIESRRGVPGNVAFEGADGLEKQMRGEMLRQRRELDDIAAMRVVPVFHVTAYEEPSHPKTASGPIGVYFGGEVAVALAVVDLQERRVLCRTTARAESSKNLDMKAEGTEVVGDPVASDLRTNLDRAIGNALTAATPLLATKQ